MKIVRLEIPDTILQMTYGHLEYSEDTLSEFIVKLLEDYFNKIEDHMPDDSETIIIEDFDGDDWVDD